MRHTTRYEQKPVQVVLCDNCQKDLGRSEFDAYASVNWSEHCPHDDCWSDSGDLAFCSHRCFKAGIGKLADQTSPDDDMWAQSVTLRFRSRGAGDNLREFFVGLLGEVPK